MIYISLYVIRRSPCYTLIYFRYYTSPLPCKILKHNRFVSLIYLCSLIARSPTFIHVHRHPGEGTPVLKGAGISLRIIHLFVLRPLATAYWVLRKLRPSKDIADIVCNLHGSTTFFDLLWRRRWRFASECEIEPKFEAALGR